MPAPPAKAEISAAYPNPSNATARTGFGKLWETLFGSGGLLGADGTAAAARTALAAFGSAGGTLTGAVNEAHGADIASASTINLTTATGNLVDVTGTTTITAITLGEGAERTVRFTGALTLTHGASLVLPGADDIATAAGDFAVFRGYATGVVRCVTYTKASGVAVVAPDAATTSASGIVELATDAETVTGTDTARATTPSGVAAAIAAAGVGFGGTAQAWQDVSGSRATATMYTNSTGAGIGVIVAFSANTLVLELDGVTIDNFASANTNTETLAYFSVPDGGTYKATNGSITGWFEQR